MAYRLILFLVLIMSLSGCDAVGSAILQVTTNSLPLLW